MKMEMEETDTAGFGDLECGDTASVGTLHLDVEFFVPDDENDVYCQTSQCIIDKVRIRA